MRDLDESEVKRLNKLLVEFESAIESQYYSAPQLTLHVKRIVSAAIEATCLVSGFPREKVPFPFREEDLEIK